MKRLFSLFFLLPLLLDAVDREKIFSGNEDPVLFHHVNVISGHLNLSLSDGEVQGAKSLPLTRTYTSAGALERTINQPDLILKTLRGGWLIQGGWGYFPHANLLIEPSSKVKNYKAYLAQPNGTLITYSFSHKEDKNTLYLKPDKALTPGSSDKSARTNPRNNLLLLELKTGKATLTLPDGAVRTYAGPSLVALGPQFRQAFFLLEKEVLASKHCIQYSYDSAKRLSRVSVTNPDETKTFAWINFDLFQMSSPFQFHALTSNGKEINYRAMNYKLRDYLCDVQSNYAPHEAVTYAPGRKGIGARLEKFYLDDKLQFSVSYYLPPDDKSDKKWADHPEEKSFATDKVSLLEAPIGPDGQLLPIGQFTYYPNHTDVRDENNLLTRYNHNGKHLSSIEYYDKNERLQSTLKFLCQGGHMCAKTLLNEVGQPILSKTFSYDDEGNLLEETLWGNLSGVFPVEFSLNPDGSLSGSETSRKHFTYLPHFNLPLVEEEEDGLTYRYTYKKDTNLLTSKFTCMKTKVLRREFFAYDDDNLLIEEIVDDGDSCDPAEFSQATERKIKDMSSIPILACHAS